MEPTDTELNICWPPEQMNEHLPQIFFRWLLASQVIVGEITDTLGLIPTVSYSNPLEHCKTHHVFYTTGALVLFFVVVCLFIYPYLAAMGLCWQCRLLTVVASVVAACGLWSMGSVVEAHRLSCPVACGILAPRTGIEPTSTALSRRLNHWTTSEVPCHEHL